MISLTDRIVSDNRQLIVPLLPAYVSKSADSAVQRGCDEGTWYLEVLHAAGIFNLSSCCVTLGRLTPL